MGRNYGDLRKKKGNEGKGGIFDHYFEGNNIILGKKGGGDILFFLIIYTPSSVNTAHLPLATD